MRNDYRLTKVACYIGYITQAVVINFPPLLFLTFQNTWGLSDSQLSLVIILNFAAQLLIDFLSAYVIDKINLRAAMIIAGAAATCGLVSLAFLPLCFPVPYAGILCASLICSVGSGLTEVLISPTVERCPSEHKAAEMGLLHSFYSWGCVLVILLSTAAFALVGLENWRFVACFWALIPLFDIVLLVRMPIPPAIPEEKRMNVRSLASSGTFWVLFLIMFCAGAGELAVSQWASKFAEAGLQVPKTVGDLAGPCAFAVLMGIARVLYGKLEKKIPLNDVMITSALLLVASYLVTTLVPNPVVNLIGLGFCGFFVGIMWPGALSIGARKMPYGGTAMFSLLALAGDLGCTVGPALVGVITDATGGNMQTGLLIATVYPALLALGLLTVRFLGKKEERSL